MTIIEQARAIRSAAHDMIASLGAAVQQRGADRPMLSHAAYKAVGASEEARAAVRSADPTTRATYAGFAAADLWLAREAAIEEAL